MIQINEQDCQKTEYCASLSVINNLLKTKIIVEKSLFIRFSNIIVDYQHETANTN